MTHYPIPGLTKKSSPPKAGRARGSYRSTRGKLFCCVGQTIYYVDANYNWQKIGDLVVQRSTPVSMVDNGQTLLVVDGSQFGYQVDLIALTFAEITDPNFLGADRIDFLSTFVVSNVPGTQEFQSTLSGAPLTWDGLYVDSKTGFPDLLQTLIVMHLEIWLIGALTTEIWYNAGGAAFPFALFPGTFIEHGTIAKYSVAKHDLRVLWLSQDKDGKAIVVMGESYKVVRVSTYAIEEEFSKYANLTDAVADIYQIVGHIFYRLHFPSADKTWVLDLQTGLWHEIESTDAQGTTHRARDMFATAAYGRNVSLDWNNGDIYEISTETYTDGAAVPRVFRRSFPTLISNGSRVAYFSFAADMELGTDAADVGDPGVEIFLRWSDDGGKTWSQPIAQYMGTQGQTLTQAKWWKLGNSRRRVFELFWSVDCKTALNGAWVDGMPMAS